MANLDDLPDSVQHLVIQSLVTYHGWRALSRLALTNALWSREVRIALHEMELWRRVLQVLPSYCEHAQRLNVYRIHQKRAEELLCSVAVHATPTECIELVQALAAMHPNSEQARDGHECWWHLVFGFEPIGFATTRLLRRNEWTMPLLTALRSPYKMHEEDDACCGAAVRMAIEARSLWRRLAHSGIIDVVTALQYEMPSVQYGHKHDRAIACFLITFFGAGSTLVSSDGWLEAGEAEELTAAARKMSLSDNIIQLSLERVLAQH